MSGTRAFDGSAPRITPWVGRLLAANAVVLLLQETILTSPAVTAALWFDPQNWFQRPWTFLSYMFVHGGLLHLAANSLMLFVFGPPVERRLGSRAFLLYYLYCGIGAAVFSLLISGIMPSFPFVGASGAVLGVALAFARLHPDATLIIFPIPAPIRAKWLVAILAGIDVIGALFSSGDGIAHGAHLGGLLFGAIYFTVRQAARNDGAGSRLPPMSPRMPVAAGRFEPPPADGPPDTVPHRRSTPRPASPPPDPAALESAELDRLLDKIGRDGIGALTDAERRFLDEAAARRRGRPGG